MPRPKRLRKVVAPPRFKSYKPTGVNTKVEESVELNYEEYEALKLSDYDLMNHAESAKLMGVSRPTFARIYEEARRKIAKALVEVKEIKAIYGNALLEGAWYVCNDCHARFSIPEKINDRTCALCSSNNIEPLNNK